MTDELKPCPWCGGPAQKEQDRSGEGYTAITCAANCPGYAGEFCEYEADAIAAWNRRSPGWVSTKERLPDINGQYLTYLTFSPTGSSDGPLYEAIWWTNGQWGWRYSYLPIITHWQPLPLPPAPGEGE